MNKNNKKVILVLLFLLLIIIKAFGSKLFYDPLILYFKNDYLYTYLPNINTYQLLKHLFFRYFLNSLISITIIWVIFKKKEYVKFSTIFMLIAFLILITVFLFLLNNKFENGYLLPFYIRRFIIHPLFLLLLLPAFYYQKLSNR